jgi:hypothetical protein
LKIASDQSILLKSVKIYSIAGKDVTGINTIQKRSENGYQLDISILAAGTYLIFLEGEGRKVFTGKFVKR